MECFFIAVLRVALLDALFRKKYLRLITNFSRFFHELVLSFWRPKSYLNLFVRLERSSLSWRASSEHLGTGNIKFTIIFVLFSYSRKSFFLFPCPKQVFSMNIWLTMAMMNLIIFLIYLIKNFRLWIF